jgi:hypothetical protein
MEAEQWLSLVGETDLGRELALTWPRYGSSSDDSREALTNNTDGVLGRLRSILDLVEAALGGGDGGDEPPAAPTNQPATNQQQFFCCSGIFCCSGNSGNAQNQQPPAAASTPWLFRRTTYLLGGLNILC